jgi:predicted deacylase
MVVNGIEKGKTLYIQAAIDGDELNGAGVVCPLAPRLDSDTLSGTVFIVGTANYFGFAASEHRNLIDNKKLNRAYPGDPDGTSTERIAAATFDVAKRADLVLDLHQGSTSRMINEVRVPCGSRHRLHEEYLELAKVFNCGCVYDQKGPDSQLARAIADEGIPVVDPELGRSVGFDEEIVQVGVDGVRNVLRYYDFLPGPTREWRQTRASTFQQYVSPTGGLVDCQVELGDRVTKRTTLF